MIGGESALSRRNNICDGVLSGEASGGTSNHVFSLVGDLSGVQTMNALERKTPATSGDLV